MDAFMKFARKTEMLVNDSTRERNRPVHSTENIVAVTNTVREQPLTLTRHRLHQFSDANLKNEFAMKPYKIQFNAAAIGKPSKVCKLEMFKSHDRG